MNKIVRFIGLSFITILYCFAIGIVDIASAYSFNSVNLDSEQQSYFTLAKTNLYCHKSQTEESVNTFNEVPRISFKDRFNRFSIIIENIGRFFESKFSQYGFLSANFLIRYRKCNFLFPFHYFW